jgi:hypothetical protein
MIEENGYRQLLNYQRKRLNFMKKIKFKPIRKTPKRAKKTKNKTPKRIKKMPRNRKKQA